MRRGLPSLLLISVVLSTESARAQVEVAAVPARPEAARQFVTTVERARQALQVARLAAENGMQDLSLRAVRDSLAGGPPVQAIQIQASPVRTSRPDQSDPYQQFIDEIEQALYDLNPLWEQREFDPQAVFETLAVVVLPPGRADEIFLYPKSLMQNNQPDTAGLAQQRNVGVLLAQWAARAGRLEELEQRVSTRADQPRAKIEGLALLTQIALAAGETGLANERLSALQAALRQNTLQHAAELACHVALPALANPDTAQAALPLVEQAVESLAGGTRMVSYQTEPASTLLLQLARARLASGGREQALKHLDRYLQINQTNNVRNSGDYGLYLRQQQLTKVAGELLRGGQTAEALQRFGEAADINTRYGTAGMTGSQALQVARSLQRLPAEERYAMLYDWSMPKQGRQLVRIMTGFVPSDRPPASFAKLVEPEHPERAFDLQTFGPMQNVVSSATMLIDAAKATGRLDNLTDELQAHAEKNVENARPVLALALLAQGQAAEVVPIASQLAEEVKQAREKNDRTREVTTDLLVAVGCIEHQETADSGTKLLESIRRHAQNRQNLPLLRQTNLARAVALSRRASPALFAGARPARWTPGAVLSANAAELGTPPNLWITHGGVIHHVTGTEHDSLYFRWPLVGEFELSVDALDGGWAESDLAYAGLTFEAQAYSNQARIKGIGNHGQVTREQHSVRQLAFVNKTLRVTPEGTTLLANGNRMFTDAHSSASSPWLALFNDGFRTGTYRHLRLTGRPVIPREVRLSDDPHMRGWSCFFYRENRPPAVEDPLAEEETQTATTEHDWWWEDGIIHGRKMSGGSGSLIAGESHAVQSHLLYHRPLQSGEQVTWEFFQEPGRESMHPCLGRVAFLLANDGVRLHWLTTGDVDWTGLSPDNAVTEPGSERGNIADVLQNGWNAATLALQGDTVSLSLNGQPVYEREMELENSRQFGLFHFKDRTAARVRNVVLRGDWPAQLDAQMLARLTERTGPEYTRADGQALSRIIGEQQIVKDAIEIVRHARTLPAEERYAYLSEWVLPGRDHYSLRVDADFTPTDPAPPVAAEFAVDSRAAAEPGARRIQTGGHLVAPLWELIDVAKELGKLDEFQAEVARAGANQNYARRARLAALSLVQLASDDTEAANQSLQELRNELEQMTSFVNWQRWPEVVAAARAIENPDTLARGADLLEYIVTGQIQQNQPGDARWAQHVRALRGRAQRLVAASQPAGSLSQVEGWAAVVHPRAESRGLGYPISVWRQSADGELRHWPGFDDDYLYYPVPLRGDFELECELTTFGWRETQIGYGGFWVEVVYSRDKYRLGVLNRSIVEHTIDPPLEDLGDWYRYKLVVKGDTCTSFVNDRQIHQQQLQADRDPWLMVRSSHWFTGGMRNLKITGNPTVPESLDLITGEQMTGWSARYFDESLGPLPEQAATPSQSAAPKPDWRVEDGVLIGEIRPALKDVVTESILQYHRPLLEDGALEYTFHYVPGRELVHPALDRLVFLLDPDKGVRVHWLTDGKYDRTSLAPDNVFDEPDHRTAETLHLKPGANRLQLAVAGDTVQLTLNDSVIYRRPLEQTNQRIFGLFHYKERTLARVESIRYSGEWPQEFDGGTQVAAGRE